MKKRDPLRFRKSEIGNRKFQQRQRAAGAGLPRPATDRQLAFCILDEHRQTQAFVGQLLDSKLDGLGRSFPGKQPLAGRVAQSRDSGEPDSVADGILDTNESEVPGSPSLTAALKKPSRFDRRFVSEMVHGVVRRQATLDALLASFVTRPRYSIEDQLWQLLQLGLYQIVFMRGVPEHAAVHETVELGRWAQQPRWCGFMNGVLRSITREIDKAYLDEPAATRVPVSVRVDQRSSDSSSEESADGPCQLTEIKYREIGRDVFPPPETSLQEYVTAAFGLPEWLVSRWSYRFSPEELLEMAKWFELRQPLSLRVNVLKATRDELLDRFREAIADDSTTILEAGSRSESIRYDGPLRIVDLPGFAEGHFTVQDETAMSAGELLSPQPGERVLDLCAAPGTKTTHLAEMMQGEGGIVATDVDLGRLRRVEENADRLGFDMIQPLVLREDLSELPTGPFDAILIDVPCSNTGVLGKRPEVRSRIGQEDIEELAVIQRRLLDAAASLLRPGGRIVYSTCSIEPEENSGIITQFLERSSDFELTEVREFIPGRPSDGGYQALLTRMA